MLYLAQVQNKLQAERIELLLLAVQTSENAWTTESSESIFLEENSPLDVSLLTNGRLVLADLDENLQILAIQDAKEWVLGLVQKLSTTSSEPCSFGEEEATIEQWRQELTLQSQDMTRRNLEIETRREQIQELEQSLKQEKEQLESRWQELQQLEARE